MNPTESTCALAWSNVSICVGVEARESNPSETDTGQSLKKRGLCLTVCAVHTHKYNCSSRSGTHRVCVGIGALQLVQKRASSN